MKTTIFYCFMALAAISLSSCSAEDGKDGIDGIDGQQGPKGEPGTANVIYSDWMDIDWNFQNEISFKAMQIEADQITDDFIENGGTILMYLKQTAPTGEYAVSLLPYDLGNDGFTYGYVNAPSSLGFVGIMLQVGSIDDTTPVSSDYENGLFLVRYVLIPGGTPVSNSGARDIGDLDLDNYEAVADYYGLMN